MIARNNLYSDDKIHHKFGFIENNKFFFRFDYHLVNVGLSIKDLESIIILMKGNLKNDH